ncbi:MAG TPA: FtsX-like permease family protein, partial [Chitinophagaceae bacterium]|nr:FtsX-like permease family protein [Chitinophagaceae bacterium]
NTLLNIPGVQYVSKTTTVPGDALSDTSTVAFKYSGKEYRMTSVKVSSDYFKTLHIALAQGREFDDRYSDQNTRSAIINEAAAKKLNLKSPVNAVLTFPLCDTVSTEVIGVVKNFSVSGFENTIQPVVFTIGNKACMFQSGGAILVKLNSDHIQKSIADIEKAWKKIEPDFPMRYSFLDDNFQNLFLSYKRLQEVINFFGGIAILISVMGLFALTAFLINQRAKEIAVRKILGASVSSLGVLVGRNFIRLVVVAVLIAIPLGWWAAGHWLKSFAYHISIDWMLFITAAIIIISIAVITISFQAIKAAIANPVKSLRTE